MSTICLNMIVKNEAAIIADTLANILEHIRIDYWVIADTGSSDDTMAIVRTFFQERGIAGELLQHDWKDFGHNRQLVLEAAQGKTDYVFFFDADDRFEGQFTLPENLTTTFYNLFLTNAQKSTRYPRRLLAKNDGSVYWKGVLHEVILPKIDHANQEEHIEGPYHVISGRFGARNQDPDKYFKDAQVLAAAFETETNIIFKRRYSYYCGQSYRDCNRPDLAVIWFERNIQLCEPHGEEVRFSYIALGTEYNRMNNHAKTAEAWWSAYNAMPQNAEALALLAQLYNNNQQFQLGFDVAKKASTLPDPDPQKTLFVNDPIHRYMIWYEVARNAIKINLAEEAYFACRHLLNQTEHSEALNDFIVDILYVYKNQIEQDTLANAKQIYIRLTQLTLISEKMQPIYSQLLQWFQNQFASTYHPNTPLTSV